MGLYASGTGTVKKPLARLVLLVAIMMGRVKGYSTVPTELS